MKEENNLFVGALICYLIFRVLYGSNLNYEHVFPKIFFTFFYTTSCILSILKLINNFKFSVIGVITCFVILSFAIYFHFQYKYYLVAPCLLIFSAKDIPFRTILKTQYRTVLCLLLFLLLAVSTGLISDLHFSKKIVLWGAETVYMAHGLGFVYFSGFAYYVMLLLLLSMLLREQMSLFSVAIMLFISFTVYELCYTRIQIIGCLFIVIFFYVLKKWRLKFESRIWGFIAYIIYPLFFIGSCLLPFMTFYGSAEATAEDIDESVNGRMMLNTMAFSRYDINFLGNRIEIETGKRALDYFYIDSGYVYSLLGYGIIFSFILLLMYSTALYKAYKNGNIFVYFGLLFFMILNVFNDFFMQLNFNPLLLYLFSDDKKNEK